MAIQRILFRRGTPADWSSINPVLAPGEPAYELPTTDYPLGRFKIGNGVLSWADLPYFAGAGGTNDGGGGDPGTFDGTVTAAQITDASDIGRSVLKAADASAARNALGVTWGNLSGKPAYIGAGTTADAARDAIGAVSLDELGTAVDNAEVDIRNSLSADYARKSDLLLEAPYRPLTADLTVPQNIVDMKALTGFSRAVEANSWYRFAMFLDYDVMQAVDLKVSLRAPTGSELRGLATGLKNDVTSGIGSWGGAELDGNASVYTFGGVATTATATTAAGSFARGKIEGYIKTGTTAGSLALWGTQAVAGDFKTLIKASSTFDLALCATPTA